MEAHTRAYAEDERHHVELTNLRTAVEGDIGLAWGVYTEDFQQRGWPPEHAQVRFSCTYKREPDGWTMLSYHRDIQPFDEQRRYARSLTAVRPQ